MWKRYIARACGPSQNKRMRRREKFVIASILLSLALLATQVIPLEFRYFGVGGLTVLSYFVAAWALSDDLQAFEWTTILPLPTLYAAGVGLFYFLLPENIVTRLFIMALFGIGMYGLFLTANIYSVAKGRSIQLIHAAHAIGLLFTLLTSLLFTNTIFSLRLPFYLIVPLVGMVHFPLISMSLWAVNLEQRVTSQILTLSSVLTLLMMELALALSLYPFSVWNQALLLMAALYIGLGIAHNFLRGVLFSNTIREYSLVASLVVIIFFLLFPLK